MDRVNAAYIRMREADKAYFEAIAREISDEELKPLRQAFEQTRAQWYVEKERALKA